MSIKATIKDYKELQAQIKIARNNQKELNEALKNAKPGVEFGKYQKQLKEVEFELQSLQKQAEDVAYVLSKDLGDDAFNSLLDGGKTLEAELRNITNTMKLMALAGQQDTEAFRLLQEEAIEMKNSIIAVNKEMNTLSGTTGINTISDQFRNLGASILTLNFEGATKQATTLTTALNSISWSSTISGIKGMTSAFSSLGKALLSNPIMIMASVVIGIGAAIYKLMKETGLLQVAMEALGKVFEWLMTPINILIKGLKLLTDSFGLTNNAQKEMADEAVKSATKAKNAYEGFYKDMDIATSNYIKNKQAELDAIEDSEEGALKKRLEIQKQINSANEAQAQRSVKNADNAATEALKILQKFQVENGKNTAKYTTEQLKEFTTLKNAYDDARRELTKAQYYASTTVFKESSDAIKAIIKSATDYEKEQYQKRLEASREFADNRIKAERAIRDAELGLMDANLQKDLLVRQETYKRYLEDIKRDTTLLKSERDTLLKLAEEQYHKDIKEIQDKAWDEVQKTLDKNNKEILKKTEEANKKREELLEKAREALKEHNIRVNELNMTEREKSISDIKAYYDELWKETVHLYSNMEEAMVAYYKLQAQMQAEIDEINKKADLELQSKRLDTFVQALKNAGGEYASLFGNIAAVAKDGFDQMNTILNDVEATTTDKVAGIANVISGVMGGIFDAMSQAVNEALERDLNAFANSMQEKFDALDNQLLNQMITQEEYNKEKQKLEVEANKKENEIRKEAFEENKKSQIANATMQMLSGAVAAFAGAMSLGPIAGPIVGGILAAAVLAMGASNISRIKDTQYQATNTSALGGGSDSISTPNTPTQPTFTFQGGGNNANTSTTGGINKVVVSVTDIQDAFVEVSTTDEYTTLGGGSDGPG